MPGKATANRAAATRARAWASGVVVGLVLLGPAAGALGTPVSAALAAPSGKPAAPGVRLSVPHPGSLSSLGGLSCPSRSSCWAVGYYSRANGAFLNQALHWNGARWSVASVPSPGGTAGTDVSGLFGVSCASPSSCWAVGSYLNSRSAVLNQALHWNGARWSVVSVPSPGGTAVHDASQLLGVRCISSGNCWAVGVYRDSSEAQVNQALHWNGRTWSAVPTAAVGAGSALNGVACTSSADCWAVGSWLNSNRASLNLVMLWNGANWFVTSISDPGGIGPGGFSTLNGVACTSSTDCWAAGHYATFGGTLLNQVQHWAGGEWTLVPTPDPAGTGAGVSNALFGVACVSAADCWAVGAYAPVPNGSGPWVNQVLHWNGQRWSWVSAPNPGGIGPGAANMLRAAACTSPANCWAVGFYDGRAGAFLNQALHWNGAGWSIG